MRPFIKPALYPYNVYLTINDNHDDKEMYFSRFACSSFCAVL